MHFHYKQNIYIYIVTKFASVFASFASDGWQESRKLNSNWAGSRAAGRNLYKSWPFCFPISDHVTLLQGTAQKENSLGNITWSEMGKQNVQAKEIQSFQLKRY